MPFIVTSILLFNTHRTVTGHREFFSRFFILSEKTEKEKNSDQGCCRGGVDYLTGEIICTRRKQAAAEAREAALVSKHAVELSHAVGRQREELRRGPATATAPLLFNSSSIRSSICGTFLGDIYCALT